MSTGWLKETLINISLEGYGAATADFYISILDPGSVLWGITRESEAGTLKSVEDYLTHIIRGWNVTSPFTGEPLPLPTLEDQTPLSFLPTRLVTWMVNEIAALMSVEAEQKKGSPSKPSLSSRAFMGQPPPAG